MRTGPAAGHDGYFHEAVCYSSADELLAVAVPFLRDGVAAGEPTVISLAEHKADLIRSVLPAALSGVTFLTTGSVYAGPAVAIRSYRDLLASYAAAGAHQIRLFGELPAVAFGATWDWWARYESAINHAFDEFPLWSICAYDRRVTPAPVLVDVAKTHPRMAMADGRHVLNDTYTDPVAFLRESREVAADPIQLLPPAVDLLDPLPVHARRAVRAADPGSLPARDVDGLVLAVSETVTNAVRHGQPPVRLRCWAGPDRIVVEVSDSGVGPKDPFAGLLPAGDGGIGGLGLWIAFQSCSHVSLHHTSAGFTLRLTAGTPTRGDTRSGQARSAQAG